jgi:superfamily II DNA or RNA helicase
LPSSRALETPRSKARFFEDVRALTASRDYRPYQADAAWKVMKALVKNNVLLTLPQGTGKTYVSQLVAYGLLRANAGMKVLVITPAKELRKQYVDMAGWMGEDLDPRLVVIPFDDTVAGNRKVARIIARGADVIVATPQFLANRHSYIDSDTFDAITLCILDEVDLWPVEDFQSDDEVRLHAAIVDLMELLVGHVRFLGLTASPLTGRGAHMLLDRLALQDVKPFDPSIVPHLPRVRITPVACGDSWVERRDAAITEESKKLFGQLGAMVDIPPGKDAWGVLKAVAGGKFGFEAAELARGILGAQHERVQLYEDVLGGHGRKLAAARKLAATHAPTVILCREIQTVETIATGMRSPRPTIAHSGIGDRYLNNIDLFKKGRSQALLMTRELGKRGVDFPMAKSLVVLSPKTSVMAMDQELCRTRSKRAGGAKEVFILFYARTYEEEKLRTVLLVLTRIKMYDKHAKFTLDKHWTGWLNARRPVTLARLLRP